MTNCALLGMVMGSSKKFIDWPPTYIVLLFVIIEVKTIDLVLKNLRNLHFDAALHYFLAIHSHVLRTRHS